MSNPAEQPKSAAEVAERLDWDKVAGLIPAVVQDARTLQVLMLAYMNREALEATFATGKVTFYSRTKQRLWTKGETSGHILELVDITPDCDCDALLVRALPRGPTCHRQTTSCFGRNTAPGVGFLAYLDQVIAGRKASLPEGSYTTKLFRSGVSRMAQKVGEEGVEVALAAKDDGIDGVQNESADLLYHLLVLLRGKETDIGDVIEVLRRRHG